ncbi:hypothetical protein DRQ00_03625 [candidate division KSB1 bacterium]|nr:MAG: hypothetical protein DRQ00_03625 [candidate division KSB1 bacterium]
MYQKAFLTAKFAKKSQRSQRANYPFIKTLPTYFCGRALQSPITSPSGDNYSIGVWRRLLQSGRMEHGFCEFAIFQQNLGKIFTGVFPNLILFKTLNIQGR